MLCLSGPSADLHLEDDKGLNLFDAPDMGEGLFIGREAEVQNMESILQPQSDSPDSTVSDTNATPGLRYPVQLVQLPREPRGTQRCTQRLFRVFAPDLRPAFSIAEVQAHTRGQAVDS